MKAKPGKRTLSLFLALVLCLSLLPMTAQAGGGDINVYYIAEGGSAVVDPGANPVQLKADGDGAYAFGLSFGFPEGVYTADNAGFEQIRLLEDVDPAAEAPASLVLYRKESPQIARGAFKHAGDPYFSGVVLTAGEVNSARAYYVEALYDGTYFYSAVKLQFLPSGAASAPVIATASLPAGTLGISYAAALEGSAGDGTQLTWSVSGGSLPDGLALNAETGVIRGTPTAAGSFAFTVKAAQGDGKSATKSLSISVSQPATYTVRFDLNGGTAAGTDYSARTGLTAGEKITLPAAPARTDYDFSGWTDGAATYAAGAQYTVTGNATLRAEWKEMPGLTVSLRADMEQLVGSVWLVGINANGDKTWLWSDWYPTPTAFKTIEIPLRQLGNQTYTGLQLSGFVDGRDTVIAAYSEPIAVGENVTLSPVNLYTVLSAINVTGLTEGVDYRFSSIKKTDGEETIYSAPCLVTPNSSWQIRLNGVRGSSVYTLIDWDQVHTAQAADHSLCIDVGWAYWGGRSVTLSGRVTWTDGGEGVPYATVRATQKVGDVFRTLQTTTGGDGAYQFKLYPDTEALITVENGGQLYIHSPAGGAAYTQPVGTNPISLNLTVKRFLLTAELTLKAGAGTAADLARYLNASSNEAWLQIAAETGVDTDAFTLSGTGTIRRTTSLFYTGAASALNCTLSAPLFGKQTRSAVQGADGNWTVSFTSMLKPGVVARLSAARTTSACYAFYGADGTLLGRSSTFHLYVLAQDYAAECPVGTAKVVLVPGIYSGQLSGTAYAGVTDSGWALKTWDVSITEGKIVALEAFDADETASINSAYVTQPNSALSAGAESFLGEQDLVRFSGSIGLDAGLNNGGLRKLEIYTGNGQMNYVNTAVIQSITVGGKNYPAQQTTGLGVYVFEFSEPIALPCDYVIYCTPGNLDWDMHVTLTADVSWSGGSAFSQLIGSAVVSRPGAYIETLSTYVNQDVIQVSGVSQADEAVTIYDGGAVIGTAKGDEWGEWTAMVTLAGTDDSVPTVHRLWTVTASAAVSDTVTILHDAKGPQLTKFTMSWRDYSYGNMTTINIGDAYIYRGGMYDTTFAATFTNPDALNTMEAWGCKAVFKVFTTDGEIRFLEATQNGGVFTAAAPEALRASVTRAEVLYEPALHTGFDLKTMSGAAPAAYAAKMKAVAAEVKADNSSGYPSYVYALTYDNTGKASATALGGQAPDPVFVQNLEESAGKYPDKGLVISYVTSDDHYTTPTEEWLRLTAVDASIQNWYALRIGKYASECRMYTLSRHYIGGRDSDGNLSDAEAFKREKAYFEGLDEAVHSVFTLDGGCYDLYTIETEGTDADGTPYLDRYVTAAFAAVDGVYTSSFTVTYSDRVCLKLVREKLDKMYPQAGASAAVARTTAVAAGTANAVLRNAATDAPIRLTDEGQTEEQPTKVADVEVRFSSSFTPEMRAELEELRWMKSNTDYIFELKDEQRLAKLEHAEANAMTPTWLDESKYKYNGSFRPESNAARSAMNRVQNTTGVVESYSGDANAFMAITAALADGNNIGKAAGVNGAITAAANIYTNGVNTRDAKDELEMMRGDMEQIMSSPCYHKLTQSQKDMVDEAYDEFMQWYKTAHNHLTGVAQCNFAAGSGGVFLGKNPIGGLVMAGTGLMVSNVGGAMVDDSFGSAIITYNQGFAKIKGVLRARSKQLDDPNCKGKPVSTAGPTDGNGKNNKPGNDPSGIVYEGVIENPIKGALVTLYYGADKRGSIVGKNGAPARLKPAVDIRSLIPRSATLTTGPDGRYSWGVPQGLWYVTAEYAGLHGDSNEDTAAAVSAEIEGKTCNLLPVLPVQLDVNIPLVDPSAPMVTDVQYTTEGIYVTFSKYMDETDVLSAASYCVYAVDADTTPVAFSVTGVEQGHTPANRGAEQTYTRTVLLALTPAQAAGTELSVEVRGSVRSYAGTLMGMDYSGGGTVAEKTQLAQPTLTPASGEVTRGSCVTITAAQGTIHYTTDGSDPTADSPIYDGPVAVTGDMTIKAIAVQRGCESSPVASGSFTVKRPEIVPEEPEEPVVPVNPGDWSGETVYKVIVAETEHGRVTASRSTAPKGVEITLTVTPDEGYVLDSLKAADAGGNTVIVTDNRFTMPASDVTVTVTFEAVKKDRPFTDVKESDWFYAAVYHCFDAGYFKGVSETRFDPQGTMTRAMFATVLWRIAGEPEAGNAKAFTDVKEGQWYTAAVLWASGAGVIDGYGDGTFGPDDPITREQMVTLLWRFSGKPVGNTDLSGYQDADQISDWAKEAFVWAVGVGLVQGKGDGVLDPGGKATRAEVAQIVMNFDMVEQRG